MTNIEIFCLLAALLLNSARRIISGAKNAALYAKGKYVGDIPGYIFRWIQNLHRLESPAWYAQFGAVFLFLVAYQVKGEWSYPNVWSASDTWYLLEVVGIALLGAQSASALAGPLFQGPINQASGKPFIDRNENPKSEFVLGPISFWWPRPWKGVVRIVGATFGAIGIFATLYLLH